MATMANGSRLSQNGYEYGVKFEENDDITWFESYEHAKTTSTFWNVPMKMRCHYVSEAMEAK